MVKLRHLKARSLEQLEGDLEKIRVPIHVLSVSKEGRDWYCHFLVQDAQTKDTKDNLAPRVEETLETTEL